MTDSGHVYSNTEPLSCSTAVPAPVIPVPSPHPAEPQVVAPYVAPAPPSFAPRAPLSAPVAPSPRVAPLILDVRPQVLAPLVPFPICSEVERERRDRTFLLNQQQGAAKLVPKVKFVLFHPLLHSHIHSKGTL